ncbi:hypothetical protein ACVBEQ_18710 [Nakamurella sp. GG22]
MTAFVALTLLVAVTAAIRGVWSPCGLSMVSAINPFTERAQGHRYWLTAAWFIAGSVLGGLVFGAVGAVGAVLLKPLTGDLVAGDLVTGDLTTGDLAATAGITAAVAAACCLVTSASDVRAFGFRLPLHPRQVNERWIGRYRRWVYAAGFGAQIGAGLATYIMTAAVYLVPVLGALSGSPAFALTAGAVFGAVRGAAVLLSAGATDPAGLRRLHRILDRFDRWSLRAAVAVQLIAAGTLAFAAAGPWGLAVAAAVIAAGAATVAHRCWQLPIDATGGPLTVTGRPPERRDRETWRMR